MLSAPSLYDSLVQAIPAAKNATGLIGQRSGKISAPLWTDALDLRVEIDGREEVAPRQGDDSRAIVGLGRRQMATARLCPSLEDIAARLESWAIQINSLLNPQHVKHLSVPCPACNATYVYRRDFAGERVRQPALQIVADTGCTCQACRHTWLPQHYLLLCRVLGFEVPAGVIEG